MSLRPLRTPHEQVLFAILRVGDDICTALSSVENEIAHSISGGRSYTDEEIWERVDDIQSARISESVGVRETGDPK